MNPPTSITTRAFQLANGIEATGVIDQATYDVLFGENAVYNPNPTSTEATTAVPSGPVQLPSVASASDLIITNEINQSYTDTASQVVTKTNKVTEKALSNSSSVIPTVSTAQVKRTANIWLWFVLVAVILGATAFVFFIRDKKTTRYEKYKTKKRRYVTKAELSGRW